MRLSWVTALLVGTAIGAASAQAPGEAMTLRGEIVEVSCYSKLGIDKATGPEHVACAKACAAKGQALGILTDGDGLIKITGDYADNNYEKLTAYVGQQVEVVGTRDRFLDYSRAIRVTKLEPLASAAR
jgi:hypothetical protein